MNARVQGKEVGLSVGVVGELRLEKGGQRMLDIVRVSTMIP
jgi:hypothetical protein